MVVFLPFVRSGVVAPHRHRRCLTDDELAVVVVVVGLIFVDLCDRNLTKFVSISIFG